MKIYLGFMTGTFVFLIMIALCEIISGMQTFNSEQKKGLVGSAIAAAVCFCMYVVVSLTEKM